MSAKLFVGNLNPRTSGEQLTRFFSSAGFAATVRLPLDRRTGRPRGFAFVDFASEEQAQQALRVFDGRELGGRRLKVSTARPEKESHRPEGLSHPEQSVGVQMYDELQSRSNGDRGRFQYEQDPYHEDSGRRRRRHGKHGSDRRRSRGLRRYLD